MFSIPVTVPVTVPVTEPDIALYTLDNLDELSEDLAIDIDYFKTLIKHGVTHFVENIIADVNILKIDNQCFPLLITSGNYDNAYVCSPYGHYISLGLESLSRIKNRWKKKIIECGLKGLGKMVKAGNINPAVYINHSLFSTDLQPNNLTESQIDAALSFLKRQFPDYTLIFRSINAKTCPELKKRLKTCGFKFIVSRQIYLTDAKNKDLYNIRIIKSDLRLWNKKEYELISQNELSEADEERILALCHSLAIDNHSTCNPKPTQHCLKLLKQLPSFQIKALKKNGIIEGVAGYHIKDNVLHCSLLDTIKTTQTAPLCTGCFQQCFYWKPRKVVKSSTKVLEPLFIKPSDAQRNFKSIRRYTQGTCL